jgi:capsular exopolysaccharide synthesis family protein
MLVDAVARVYETKLGEAERRIRKSRVDKLDKMIERLQGYVNRRMDEYKAMVLSLGAQDSRQKQVQSHFQETLLDSLLKDRVFYQQKLQMLQLRHKQRQDRKEGTTRVPRVELEKELKEETTYKAVSAQIEEQEAYLVKAEPFYVDKKHPKLEEARQKLKELNTKKRELRKKLLPEVRKKLIEYYEIADEDSEQDTKDEILLTVAVLDKLTEEMNRLADQVQRGGYEGLELDLKKDEFEIEKGVVNGMRSIRVTLDAEQQQSTSTAQVQEPAKAYPNPNRKQLMMAGGAGCAALGMVLLAFAYWEFRLRRINTVEDVVYGLGWRLVGQLPALPERARGGLLRKQSDPRYWQSLMTESVDATRTMILHAARVEGIRTVMVTSAVSGEGKTSLSCHLACSLARAGRKTLLLDCDLRNPAAHRLFELPGEPGLCEVLRGQARLADVIRPTPANNLWLIPAGQFDEQALQMLTLTQEGFSPLLQQLKTQFDFIVVDSSPVLPVVDTLVVGQNVDVVVFSLLRDVSRIPSVYAAYQRLATLDIHILGAVVNGVDAGGYGYAAQYASYVKQPV